jgi:hypothetical protein
LIYRKRSVTLAIEPNDSRRTLRAHVKSIALRQVGNALEIAELRLHFDLRAELRGGDFPVRSIHFDLERKERLDAV